MQEAPREIKCPKLLSQLNATQQELVRFFNYDWYMWPWWIQNANQDGIFFRAAINSSFGRSEVAPCHYISAEEAINFLALPGEKGYRATDIFGKEIAGIGYPWVAAAITLLWAALQDSERVCDLLHKHLGIADPLVYLAHLCTRVNNTRLVTIPLIIEHA